ncbi:MAG: thiol:disulfide interchange protein DsbA/DsbL [Betaproteobacteria bacterium]|nr:thiol:disulfide interchange protein DsbA/DsbL [Betaproteobacteria bacterium]
MKLLTLLKNLSFATLLGAVSWSAAAQHVPQAGTDYRVLDRALSTEAPPGKIEVIEFFWYGCPHCNAFEPALEAWAKQLPKDVLFRRVPVAFSAAQMPHTRIYYALEALGKLPELHTKVFAAIHVQHMRLLRPEEIADWMAQQGINRDEFMKAYTSFTVQSKSTRATQTWQAYNIDGVPTMAVAGKYVTSGSMAGTNEKALAVVDYLVAKERKEMGRK